MEFGEIAKCKNKISTALSCVEALYSKILQIKQNSQSVKNEKMKKINACLKEERVTEDGLSNPDGLIHILEDLHHTLSRTQESLKLDVSKELSWQSGDYLFVF